MKDVVTRPVSGGLNLSYLAAACLACEKNGTLIFERGLGGCFAP